MYELPLCRLTQGFLSEGKCTSVRIIAEKTRLRAWSKLVDTYYCPAQRDETPVQTQVIFQMLFYSPQWSCLLLWKPVFLQLSPFSVKQLRRSSFYSSRLSLGTLCKKLSGHPRKYPKENVDGQETEFLMSICAFSHQRQFSTKARLSFDRRKSLQHCYFAGTCSRTNETGISNRHQWASKTDSEVLLLHLLFLFLLPNYMIRLIWKRTGSQETSFSR